MNADLHEDKRTIAMKARGQTKVKGFNPPYLLCGIALLTLFG